MPEFVLRIPLEDPSAGETAVLVNVRAPAKESGELIIEGTEGETPYVASFSQKALSAARSASSPIPASAWKETLVHLLQHGPPPPLPEPAPKLSLTASLGASTSLTLHLRQTLTGGISQRLGELKLDANPDHEIDTLAWTATAVARSANLSSELVDAAERVKVAETRAQVLSNQLEELVKTRKENEDAMLVAFADLLNEKKRKIRELQRCVEELRLTDGGNSKEDIRVDTKESTKTESTTKGRKAGTSRTGKRKAKKDEEADGEVEAEGVMDSNDANDEVDEDYASQDSSDFERMRSPGAERDDDSTDAGSDNEGGEQTTPANQPPTKRGVGKIGGKADAKSNTTGKKEDSGGKVAGKAATKAKNADPPPRRELPFTRQKQVEKAKKTDDGGDTSDDEL